MTMINGDIRTRETIEGGLNTRFSMSGDLTTSSAGGTTDYEELTNKPSINGVELVGNKTSYDLEIPSFDDLPVIANYSEQAHNTFIKWVDSKDIWRKVIYFTPPSSANATVTITTIEHYGELIKMDAMLYYQPYNQWLPLNYSWQSSNAGVMIFMRGNQIMGQFSNMQTYRSGKIIIEYTLGDE